MRRWRSVVGGNRVGSPPAGGDGRVVGINFARGLLLQGREGDGPVGGSKVAWFAYLGNRGDGGLLPY